MSTVATDPSHRPSVSSDDTEVALRDLAHRLAGRQRNDKDPVNAVGAGLIRSSRYLRQIIEGEIAWPTQKQWKDRLAALRCAAGLVARELGDGRMMNALDTFDRQSRNPSHISLDNLRENVETLTVLARQTRDQVPSGSGQPTLELYPAALSAPEI
jgi:hypothetical protein